MGDKTWNIGEIDLSGFVPVVYSYFSYLHDYAIMMIMRFMINFKHFPRRSRYLILLQNIESWSENAE